MKKTITLLIFFVIATYSYAQKNVAVLSGTTWTFYDDFSPALRAAPSGSIIYLPGGTFDLVGSDTINKQLTIIGAGFSLDSAGATGITRFIGGVFLDNGSDNTSIEGISMDYLQSQSDASYYNNILIKRCFVSTLNFYNRTSVFGKNYYVTESVICTLNGGSDPYNGIYHYNNLKVEKSIVLSYLYNCYGSTFNNNVLLLGANSIYNNACEFNNNIFTDSARTYEVAANSIFNNNIFRVSGIDWTGSGSSNVYIGCTWSKLPTSIFINPPSEGAGCYAIYNTQYNYHLKSTSPAKNFGTDGTDAGIYGTSSPCKDGWVPSNPHISAKTIGPSSLSNGTLPVNIKVVAQDR